MKKIYLSLFLLAASVCIAKTTEAAITSAVYPYTTTKNSNNSWTVTVQNPAYSAPGDKYYVPANYSITASSASELRNQVTYRFSYDLPGTADGYTFYSNMFTSFGASYDDIAAKTGTTYTGTVSASATDSFTVNGSYQSISVNPGDTVTFSWSAANTNHTDSFYVADKADTCANGFDASVVAKPWIANTQTGTATIAIQPCQAGVTYTYTFEIYRALARVVQKTVVLRVSSNLAAGANSGTGTTGTGNGSTGGNSSITNILPGTQTTATTTKATGRKPIFPTGTSGRGVEALGDQVGQTISDSIDTLVNKYEQKYEEASGLRGGVNARAAAGPVTSARSAGTSCSQQLTSNLRTGDAGSQVSLLTQVLVSDGDMSTPQSTFDQSVFGAVVRYQEKYADKILVPAGLDRGTGFVGPSTRSYMNAKLCPAS